MVNFAVNAMPCWTLPGAKNQGLYSISCLRTVLDSKNLISFLVKIISFQSLKLSGSPKSEASEIMLQTSETILALVRSD